MYTGASTVTVQLKYKVKKGSKCSSIKFLFNKELKNLNLRAQEQNNRGIIQRELKDIQGLDTQQKQSMKLTSGVIELVSKETTR